MIFTQSTFRMLTIPIKEASRTLIKRVPLPPGAIRKNKWWRRLANSKTQGVLSVWIVILGKERKLALSLVIPAIRSTVKRCTSKTRLLLLLTLKKKFRCRPIRNAARLKPTSITNTRSQAVKERIVVARQRRKRSLHLHGSKNSAMLGAKSCSRKACRVTSVRAPKVIGAMLWRVRAMRPSWRSAPKTPTDKWSSQGLNQCRGRKNLSIGGWRRTNQ